MDLFLCITAKRNAFGVCDRVATNPYSVVPHWKEEAVWPFQFYFFVLYKPLSVWTDR